MSFPEKWNASRKFSFPLNAILPSSPLFLLVFVVVQPLLESQTRSLGSRSGSRAFFHRCLIPSAYGANSRGAVGRPVFTTIELWPLVGDEDPSVDPSALGQLEAAVEEKKKRRKGKAPGSSSSEKKKPKDDPKKDDFFVAHGTTTPEEREAVKEEIHEADRPKARGVDEETEAETSRDASHTPKEELGIIEISGLGDLEVPRKGSSSEVKGVVFRSRWAEFEPEVSQPIPYPERGSRPQEVYSHFRCLVTKEDQTNMNEVDVPCMFNEAHQALNQVNQLAEIKEFAEKRDTYKLLSEQHGGVVKNLQTKLDAAQKEHADLVGKVKVFKVSNEDLAMVTNDQTSQVQQKIDRIDQLRAEMNEVQVMADVWKGKMDRLALEKETAQTQLASVEVQLQVTKEKADKRARLNEELRAQLNSALVERDALGSEYESVKAQMRTTSTDAEEMVAQYGGNVEASEARLKTTVECIDLSAEIEEAKRLEVKAKKLADPEDEEGSKGSDIHEGEEGLDDSGNEAGSDEDRA
uniref:Uncharacterized protein n=1 Tax=Nicotiana tabacum TaxID=4097 RepID=A0A1S4BEL1_TOBAC|nr:PREDICTED: uncharacterized protein LOC107807455 [Nicotiana tabacum]